MKKWIISRSESHGRDQSFIKYKSLCIEKSEKLLCILGRSKMDQVPLNILINKIKEMELDGDRKSVV